MVCPVYLWDISMRLRLRAGLGPRWWSDWTLHRIIGQSTNNIPYLWTDIFSVTINVLSCRSASYVEPYIFAYIFTILNICGARRNDIHLEIRRKSAKHIQGMKLWKSPYFLDSLPPQGLVILRRRIQYICRPSEICNPCSLSGHRWLQLLDVCCETV